MTLEFGNKDASSRKVLLIPSAYYPSMGGVEEIVRNLSISLPPLGWQTAIAVNRHPQDLPEHQILDGVDVRRFDFFLPSRSLRKVLELWRVAKAFLAFSSFLQSWRPDIIHVICPSVPALYIWACYRAAKCPVIVTFQGELFMDQTNIYDRSKLLRFGLRRLLRVTNAITACSQYVLNDASVKYELHKPICEVVFNGVDLAEVITASPEPVHTRRFILGLGRLVENKGFTTLIQAFRQIARQFPETDLVIVGDGTYRQELERQITAAGLQSQIFLPGRKNRAEVAAYFRDCDLFVMPSPVEPFGIVCLEAMRAGKAVIATNTGGPPEFIREAETGLLVKPNDANSFAAAITRLLSDSEFRAKLGDAGKAEVEAFSWDKIASSYSEIYTRATSHEVNA